MTPGVILGIGLCLLIVGWILRRMAGSSGGAVSTTEFNRLLKKVKTDENKDQIENAVNYHNSRVANGANAIESYQRLLRDLRRIGGLEEQTE